MSKKSFILYHENREVFEQLSDEQAGQLLKKIYAFSEWLNNPEEEKKPDDFDGLLNVIYKMFTNQLERDFKSYEKKSNENSENGKIGNLKKYHLDLYERYKTEEINLEEAWKTAKSRQVSPPVAPRREGSQEVANLADKDKDKDKDIKKNKQKKDLEKDFEEFWGKYDNKKSKPKAFKAYEKAREKSDHAAIIEGVARYTKARGDDKSFWKHPATWLNEECWNDDYSDAKQSSSNDQFNDFISKQLAECPSEKETRRKIYELQQTQAYWIARENKKPEQYVMVRPWEDLRVMVGNLAAIGEDYSEARKRCEQIHGGAR